MSTPARFEPDSFRSFRVTGRSYDPDTRMVTLGYSLDDRVEFTETITFEPGPTGRSARRWRPPRPARR